MKPSNPDPSQPLGGNQGGTTAVVPGSGSEKESGSGSGSGSGKGSEKGSGDLEGRVDGRAAEEDEDMETDEAIEIMD